MAWGSATDPTLDDADPGGSEPGHWFITYPSCNPRETAAYYYCVIRVDTLRTIFLAHSGGNG